MNVIENNTPQRPEPRAKNLMSGTVVSIRASASLKDLARLLNRHRISGVPVVDASGRLVGVVSKTDLVRSEWGELGRSGISDFFSLPGEDIRYAPEREGAVTVADIMSRGLLTVGEETPASEVAKLMAVAGVHRVLVTRRQTLLGVISALDLLKHWPV